MPELKLFMLLLGCKPKGRHTEQHDVFFGVAVSLRDLIPSVKAFWPGAGSIHIDAWREVNIVDGYRVGIVKRDAPEAAMPGDGDNKLFFINLGGYQEGRFEEQHYTLLAVKPDKAAAVKKAKETVFFKHNHITGAKSHVDDKYGIDVDDLHDIADMLSPEQKGMYRLTLTPEEGMPEDVLHLGYLPMAMLAGEAL